MSATSTTLYAGDSYSLTTGRVTRATDDQAFQDRIVSRATHTYSQTPAARIYADSVKRVTRQNDPRALAYVIRNGGI